MRTILAVLSLVAFVIGMGYAAARSTVHAEASPASASFPITSTEAQALAWHRSELGKLDAEIARISSGDQATARAIVSVALALRDLDSAEKALRLDAAVSRHLSIAVVQSGATWVPVPPPSR